VFPPQVVAKYEIGALLGFGPFSVVRRAKAKANPGQCAAPFHSPLVRVHVSRCSNCHQVCAPPFLTAPALMALLPGELDTFHPIIGTIHGLDIETSTKFLEKLTCILHAIPAHRPFASRTLQYNTLLHYTPLHSNHYTTLHCTLHSTTGGPEVALKLQTTELAPGVDLTQQEKTLKLIKDKKGLSNLQESITFR
jgi:hypothetical protein